MNDKSYVGTDNSFKKKGYPTVAGWLLNMDASVERWDTWMYPDGRFEPMPCVTNWKWTRLGTVSSCRIILETILPISMI